MSVFELLIHQIRATNGSLFVSNTAKLSGSIETDNYSESHPDKSNLRSHADMPSGKPLLFNSMPADYDIELKNKDYAIAAL